MEWKSRRMGSRGQVNTKFIPSHLNFLNKMDELILQQRLGILRLFTSWNDEEGVCKVNWPKIRNKIILTLA